MIDPNDKHKLYLCNRGCVWALDGVGFSDVTMVMVATPDLSGEVINIRTRDGRDEYIDKIYRCKRKFYKDGRKNLNAMVSTDGLLDWAIIKEITQ